MQSPASVLYRRSATPRLPPGGHVCRDLWHRPITHFDTDAFAVKVAAEVKGFDGNDYFGKHDAKHLDPCVQFALAASDEAMHDAGFDVEGAIDRERLGVYVGSGVGGMQTLVDNVHTIADRGPRRASPYMIAMMIPNMASGNIAIRHKAKGPTLPVVTACATSAHAVGEAFRAIKHGYADAILAGGTEAAIIPDAVAALRPAARSPLILTRRRHAVRSMRIATVL